MLSALLSLTLMAADMRDSTVSAADSIGTTQVGSITVVADQLPKPTDAKNSPATRSIDQLMEQAMSSMTRRAALAAEPTIRGLQGNQLTLTIDGMKVHAACVDHMDPPTAYMELASLQKLEVQQGTDDMRYGANIGGSLTFVLREPDFDDSFAAFTTLSAESNGLGRSAVVGLNTSTDDVALRAAYTYRSANDYQGGSSADVLGSRYEKQNLTASAAYKLAPSHTLRTDVVFDDASFIGFPAMLMDTRRATGVLASATWTARWKSGWRSSMRLYANTVGHVMDDFSRPLNEVNTRPFMNSMHMPMDGRSTTIGAIADVKHIVAGGVLNLILDASLLHARATMDMLPVDTTISPMFLINVGDANIGVIGLVGRYDVELGPWTLAAQLRQDVSPRSLQDVTAQSVLSGYVPDAKFDRLVLGSSATFSAGYAIASDVRTRVSLSTSQRLPTHLEQYGFYIYDPQGRYTMIGNPNLHPERSWNVESQTTYHTDAIDVACTIHAQHIDDYIAPDPSTEVSGGAQPNERIYGNIGGANIAGANVSVSLKITDFAAISAVTGYTWGQFTTIDDAMPMIAPLFYRIRGVVGSDDIVGEVVVQGALAQDRISSIIRPENTTNAWSTLSCSVTWQVQEYLRIGLSALNLFDTFYHDHLSINDLPSPGRSFRAILSTSW